MADAEHRRNVLGGRNVSTIQEHRFTTFLDALWPGWETERMASRASQLRYIEIREAYIAGCCAYLGDHEVDRTLH